jgi:hypothetical protein
MQSDFVDSWKSECARLSHSKLRRDHTTPSVAIPIQETPEPRMLLVNSFGELIVSHWRCLDLGVFSPVSVDSFLPGADRSVISSRDEEVACSH